MGESLLTEAIGNMGAEDLLRAFENPKWGRAARALIRAELLRRLEPAPRKYEPAFPYARKRA